MKSLVIFVVLLFISMPISFAVEISIPELFEIESTEELGETTYFYAGSKLIASDNGDLKYHYTNRLSSDVESKSLPFGEPINIENRFSFTGKELDSELYYFNVDIMTQDWEDLLL